MKNTILFVSLLPIFATAQPPAEPATIKINANVSTHFLCPDPVEYIDLSTNYVIGYLPAKNIVRIRPNPDSSGTVPTILTIVGQKYMVQYRLLVAPAKDCPPYVEVGRDNVILVDDAGNTMSQSELAACAFKMLISAQRFNAVATYKDGMEAKLLSIASKGAYFFIKVRLTNHTHIGYDIDQVRFSIEDRKVLKATNSQAMEIKPEYQSSDRLSFRHTWENVYVFKKFTMPGIKDFIIRVAEKQISGRQIDIHVSYADILNADAL